MSTPSLGEAVVEVGADTRGFGRDVDRQVRSSLSKTGDSVGAQMGKRLGGALSKTVKRTALVGVGAAVGAVGVSLTKGFSRLSNIDQATAKLTGLGHSAGNVEKIMDNALDAVKGTAFGLDEAATAAAGAVAAGVQPGEALTKTLTLIGDSATIAGTDMGRMGAIFNKVAANNRVTLGIVNQLGTAGIPILQLLADSMGVSAQEATKLISAGKVGFPEFQAAMEKGLGGAAQESGKTFQGALANTQAAMGRLGASVLSGVFSKIPGVLSGVIDTLDGWAPAAERIGKQVASALSSDELKDFLSGVVAAWQTALPVITNVAQNLISAGQNIGDAFASLAPVLLPIAQVIGVGLVGAVVALAAAAVPLSAVLSGIAGWMERNATVSRILIGVIVGGIAAWKAYRFILGVVVAAKAAYTAATYGAVGASYAQAAANRAQAATMLVVTRAVQAKILAQRVLQAEIWKTAATTVKGAATMVAGWASAAAAAVSGAAVTVAGWVSIGAHATAQAARSAAAWVAGIVVPAATALASMAATVASVVAGWVLMGVQALLGAAKVAAAWLIALGPIGIVIAAVAGVVALIVANWDKIKQVTVAAWNKVTETISGAVTWVINFVRDNWPLILSLITGPVGAAVIAVVRNWDAIRNATVSAWNTISSAIGNAVNFIAGMPAKIIGVFSDAGKWLVNAGKNVIAGLTNGIKSAAMAPVNAVKDVGKSVVSGIGSALGLGSPSKLTHQQGEWTSIGLGQGILAQEKYVTDVAGAVGHNGGAAMDKAADPAKTAGKNASDNFAKGIVENQDAPKNAAGAVSLASAQHGLDTYAVHWNGGFSSIAKTMDQQGSVAGSNAAKSAANSYQKTLNAAIPQGRRDFQLSGISNPARRATAVRDSNEGLRREKAGRLSAEWAALAASAIPMIDTSAFSPTVSSGGGGGGGGSSSGAKAARNSAKQRAKERAKEARQAAKEAAAAARKLAKTIGGNFNRQLAKSDVAGVRSLFGDLIDLTRQAFSGPRETRVLDTLRKQRAELVRNRQAIDGINSRLEKELQNLQAIRQERAQVVHGLRDSLRGELDLMSGVTQDNMFGFGGGRLNITEVTRSVRALKNNALRLADRMKKLARAGIPPAMIQEIAGLGSKDGVTVADAILKGSKTEIRNLASTWKGMESATLSAGRVLGDSMFKVGIDAQLGLVRGLESQQSALQKAADRLARRVVNSMKKALQSRSPSRLTEREVGIDAGAGVGVGMVKGVAGYSDQVADAISGFVVRPDYSISTPSTRSLSGPLPEITPRTTTTAQPGSVMPVEPIDYDRLAEAMANLRIENRLEIGGRQAGTLVQVGQKTLEDYR